MYLVFIFNSAFRPRLALYFRILAFSSCDPNISYLHRKLMVGLRVFRSFCSLDLRQRQSNLLHNADSLNFFGTIYRYFSFWLQSSSVFNEWRNKQMCLVWIFCKNALPSFKNFIVKLNDWKNSELISLKFMCILNATIQTIIVVRFIRWILENKLVLNYLPYMDGIYIDTANVEFDGSWLKF